MKFFLVSILILFFSLKGKSQDSLSIQHLLDGRLEILVPKSLHKMTEDEFKYKYPNRNQKISLILTDSNLSTNLIINHMTEFGMTNDSVTKFMDMQEKKIKIKFPKAKFLGHSTTETNGKKIGFLKVITPVEDDFVFNCFCITSLQGRLLLLNFNCVIAKMDSWQITVDKMLSSIKLCE